MTFFSPSDVVGELTVATRYRSLGRCPGFSCGSHTPNRLLGPWDGARGFRADHPKPHPLRAAARSLITHRSGTRKVSASRARRKADGAARRARVRRLPANEGLDHSGVELVLVRNILEGADLDVVHAAAQVHVVRHVKGPSHRARICEQFIVLLRTGRTPQRRTSSSRLDDQFIVMLRTDRRHLTPRLVTHIIVVLVHADQGDDDDDDDDTLREISSHVLRVLWRVHAPAREKRSLAPSTMRAARSR